MGEENINLSTFLSTPQKQNLFKISPNSTHDLSAGSLGSCPQCMKLFPENFLGFQNFFLKFPCGGESC
jgi:hypothetical protein